MFQGGPFSKEAVQAFRDSMDINRPDSVGIQSSSTSTTTSFHGSSDPVEGWSQVVSSRCGHWSCSCPVDRLQEYDTSRMPLAVHGHSLP